MRYLTLLIAGAVLAPLAACGSDPPRPAPVPSATTPGTAVPAPSPASTGPRPDQTTRPPRTGTTSPATRTPPPDSDETPGGPGEVPGGPGEVPGGPGEVPGGPGEVPGELPHGSRTLTGVVERSGDCTLLRVGDRRWGLTGTPAETLTAGDRVTVTGQITTAGADCAGADVARTLVVRRVSR